MGFSPLINQRFTLSTGGPIPVTFITPGSQNEEIPYVASFTDLDMAYLLTLLEQVPTVPAQSREL